MLIQSFANSPLVLGPLFLGTHQETDEMVATVAHGTNGEAKLGERQILTAALAAAGVPELATEISTTGRGVNIFHALATQHFVIVQDFASWICLEKKCSRVRGKEMSLVSRDDRRILAMRQT